MGTFSQYVDLLSSACLSEYPDNKPAKFVNNLPIPLELPVGTYCALEEIAYINAIYNIRGHNDSSMTVYDWKTEFPANSKENHHPYPTYGEFYNCPITEGFYESLEDVCAMLNRSIKTSGSQQLKEKDVFTYDKVTMKFSWDLEHFWGSLFLHGDILNVLGVEVAQATASQYIILGKSALKKYYDIPKSEASLRRLGVQSYDQPEPGMIRRYFQTEGYIYRSDSRLMKAPFEYIAQLKLIDSFLVYTSFIQPQITANTYADILRVVPIKQDQKLGSAVVTHFSKPYYLQVAKRYLQSIAIEIRDLSGRLIQFQAGVVRLKLRFTTQPPPY